MSNQPSNVVLNFKMNGQVQYAQTIREINAVMNTAAKEYKNHVAAMGDDAKATDKLAAEKKKLEIQMEAARKRTEMLRAQYDAMSKDTKTTTAQLAQMYSKLLDSERAEMSLQKSLDKVNDGLSEQGQSVRGAKDELGKLADEMQLLEAEQKKLVSSYELQNSMLDKNADETLKVEIAQKRIQDQMKLTERVVSNLENQLEQAKTAYGSNSKEVMQLETKLNGAKIEIRKFGDELESIDESSEQAEKSINSLGNELAGLTGGLIAGGGIAGIVSQALDTSSLNTKIDINFNVPEESKQTIKEAVRDIQAYGVDGEEALEGVRRQWALNKDASDEANRKIVEGAGAIAAAYNGIDFNELIQENNEIAAALEISNQEALALVDALLKAGFPPEQLDTISEYGQQMKDAGFSAKEIQAIFEAGIDTKTWNIDNLNDGVKEARIQMATFGLEVDENLGKLVEKSGISSKQFQEWGKAVAAGGEGGAKALSEVATWLDGIEDKALKNELATKVFGTKWEDQGENMIAVFQGVADAQDKTIQNQEGLNETITKLNADPAIKMQLAMSDIKEASEPLLGIFAEIISTLAGWISENPKLTATIVAIASAIGILAGAAMAIAPIITAVATSGLTLSGVFAALTGPIGLTVAAIAGLVAMFVTAYKNSEEFRNKITSVIDTVKNFIGEKLSEINKFWTENSNQIKKAIENIKSVIEFVMPFILGLIKETWSAIKNVIDGALNIIMGMIKTFSGLLTGDFSKMWEGIKQMFSGAVEAIWGIVQLGFLGKIFKVFKTFGDDAVKFITDMVSKSKGKFDEIVSAGTTKFNTLKDKILQPIQDAKNKLLDIISNIKNAFSNMSITIPKPKIPHVDVDWKSVGIGDAKIKIPTFDIDWRAQGVIFTQPTIFGASNGRLQGAGEAGPEAVLPLNDSTLGAIGEGIARTLGTGFNGTITVPVYLDGYEIARATYPHMDNMQGSKIQSNNRYSGVK
ncbi:hypothetical protein M670_00128 [Schinkia azotoformans MEV2011]|uniref:Phage-related minor tail protein n=1 Tax=Schinkia azotoformans MEV2011 TaxID=1348973 RepID=A0A072NTF3_SCHAZ|nr:hypothetical protein [Schinkia azotoformans]KEF40113.1 hypothetical protein M670_00128 [Schinkia azotoformans MEV2011]